MIHFDCTIPYVLEVKASDGRTAAIQKGRINIIARAGNEVVMTNPFFICKICVHIWDIINNNIKDEVDFEKTYVTQRN